MIETLDLEMEKLKKEYKKLRKLQIYFYKKVLLDGNDCRTNGLQWVILKL